MTLLRDRGAQDSLQWTFSLFVSRNFPVRVAPTYRFDIVKRLPTWFPGASFVEYALSIYIFACS